MTDQTETSRTGPPSGTGGRVALLPPINPGPQTPGTLTLKHNTDYTRQTSFNRATPRSARGLSKRLQAVLKKQRFDIDEPKFPKVPPEPFQPKNWKRLSEKELKKLSLIERSRYLAYEPESKEILDKRKLSLKRVRLVLAADKEEQRGPTVEEVIEDEWDSGLVGHLKAAEARHRLRTMKMGYERNKMFEISHLIASQPSSIEAVRLKCLLQPSSHLTKPREMLAKHERERCETLLEDKKGLTTNRTI